MFKITQKNNIITKKPFECKRDHLTIRGTEYRPTGESLPIAEAVLSKGKAMD